MGVISIRLNAEDQKLLEDLKKHYEKKFSLILGTKEQVSNSEIIRSLIRIRHMQIAAYKSNKSDSSLNNSLTNT